MDPLEFQVDASGGLVPLSFTGDTIHGYQNCRPGPDLVVHDYDKTSYGEHPERGAMAPLQIG